MLLISAGGGDRVDLVIPPGGSVAVDRGVDAAEIVFLSYLVALRNLDSESALAYRCDPDASRDSVTQAVARMSTIDESQRFGPGETSWRSLPDDVFEFTREIALGDEDGAVSAIIRTDGPTCIESVSATTRSLEPFVGAGASQ